MTDANPQIPAVVEPKPAATVMIIRDGGDDAGIEVFMLRRTLSAAFASGMYVFPGGRVDEGDGDDIDQAHRLAAVRECFEEAGVLLARTATGEHPSDGHPALAARHGVHDGTVDLLDLCAEHGLTPAVDELVWVAHWVTPVGESPRRFDTRFYLAPAPREQASLHDDHETIDSLWVAPADALARCTAGELMMMPPTIKCLQFLAPFASVDAAMAAARELPPPPMILPKVRFADGKIAGVVLPGEPGYDEL